MNYIGIDPGKSGAVAVIRDGCQTLFETPLNGKHYDAQGMVKLLRPYSGNAISVIERVHAMPQQGRSSMLTIGYGAGLWQGILTALAIPFSVVSAVTWQKLMLSGIGGDRKTASIVVAKRLFPGVSLRRTEKCRKDDDNLSDALLIAEYGRRTMGWKTPDPWTQT